MAETPCIIRSESASMEKRHKKDMTEEEKVKEVKSAK